MMWDMTARGVSFRAYSAGGARATVQSLDTTKLMSEMTGTLFAGEMRQAMEFFEQYGITSAIVNKNSDGVAEAIMSFLTGARSHAAPGAINDRRYRPLGLMQGETAQYDDIGQMTLLRRTGTYVLSLDGQGGANPETPGAKNDNRMVSMRHVQKQKQQRTPMSIPGGAGGGGGAAPQAQTAEKIQQYKHEGETVNTEVRCDAGHVYVVDGTSVVAVYDKKATQWTFYSKGDFNVNSQGGMNILAKGIIEIDSQAKINFCGGGPLVDPFSVSPGGKPPQSSPSAS
jgi:phage gp45-like